MTVYSSKLAYDTTYRVEEFPHEDLYRATDSISGLRRERPSLPKLHESKHIDVGDEIHDIDSNANANEHQKNPVKLGWCSGVMLRGVLSIIGTMLFLRHGFIIGQAGLLVGCLIIVVSTLVCLITSFSLSAIATNGMIKGGGAYFLLSRSLGPEWGSAIGIILTLSNCLSCSLCVVGFAETVKSILTNRGISAMISHTNDIRVISILTLCMLMIIVMASIRFETVIMYFLSVVLMISMGNFIVGSFLPTNIKRLSNGFIGYSFRAVRRNLRPKLIDGMTIGQIYGIFFPSMTGVLAGVNISGNLKDPTTAIPKGTILALLFSSFVYTISALIYGSTLLPVAPGESQLLINYPENCTNLNCSLSLDHFPKAIYTCHSDKCSFVHAMNVDKWDCLANKTCRGGPIYDYNVMKTVSAYPPLIYAGIFAATLSSASAAFVAGPKVFQALCRDNILPNVFSFLAHGNNVNDEPHRIYILEFLVNCCLVLIGNLNQIAVLVAQFTMVSYVFINYAAFDMDSSKCLGWRPAFRLFNRHLSLFGAVACFISMIIVSWWSALFTFGFVILAFGFVKRRKPNINWGSSPHAQLYTQGLKNLHKFANVGSHVKHFRPQCLILAGCPSERSEILTLFSDMLKVNQLCICANVLEDKDNDLSKAYKYHEKAVELLKDMRIKLFYSQVVATDLRSGVRALIQCTGIGACKPNVVVLGYKHDWANSANIAETENYFNIIHDAFDLNMGVVIYRNCTRNNQFSSLMEERCVKFTLETIAEEQSDDNNPQSDNSPNNVLLKPNTCKLQSFFKNIKRSKKSISPGKVFKPKISGTIDIWWLFDDGGLTVLLPYMLSKSKAWGNCKIRVFSIVDNENDCNITRHRQFANLLAKFRINYEAIHTINKFNPTKDADGMLKFNRMIRQFVHANNSGGLITEEDLQINKTKTLRQIRLRNSLLEYSKDAKIIFVTMNIPRKNTISAHLYLSWLEY
ncbi:hypothetical protein GJ496_004731 [Pomphorhynchus laevis]|nr:hypothetical protein GJ496_004731 [Pomphorhynchus laevis]